ncbi:MAG: MFS transporter [Planctomycetaceae bacterium]
MQPIGSDKARPTRVRYTVLSFMVAMAVLLYLDRYCITSVSHLMIAEMRLTNEQFGRAVGAFFFAYAFCQVPAGWLTVRYGGRLTLTVFVVGWSAATIATGFVRTHSDLVICRLLLGVMQAGAYPSAATINRAWVSPLRRATANSIVSTAGRAGALLTFAFTPILLNSISDRSEFFALTPWRMVLWTYGIVGLIWAIPYWRLFRDSPQQHPRCNSGERALIEGNAGSHTAPVATAAIRIVLANPQVWLLAAIGFLENTGWIFLTTWLPTFLMKRHGDWISNQLGVADVLAGILTAGVLLIGIAGGLTGGLLGDYLVRRLNYRWGRRLPGVCEGCLCALLYFAATITTTPWLLILQFGGIAFMIDLAAGSLWATYQEVAEGRTGVAMAFGNMCGNLGAAGFTWLIGFLADREEWNLVFIFAAISMALLALCWLCVDATPRRVRLEQIDDSIRLHGADDRPHADYK